MVQIKKFYVQIINISNKRLTKNWVKVRKYLMKTQKNEQHIIWHTKDEQYILWYTKDEQFS